MHGAPNVPFTPSHPPRSDSTRVRVGVVGARGYSGLELSRWLLAHPQADYCYAFAGKNTFSLAQELPTLAKAAQVASPSVDELIHLAGDLETVFLATPAETSLELAPKLLELGVRVIDLSGAFRLQGGTPEQQRQFYQDWYHMEHTSLPLLKQAHYGLNPFHAPTQQNQLISNPGCYATAVMMAIIPLLRAGIIDPGSLVIDAKSGTTGAGRKASEALLFSEVDGECLPYKIGHHQHWPEICQWSEQIAGHAIEPFFATHLLPTARGIIASMYATPNKNKTNLSPQMLQDQINEAYRSAFAGNPLVHVAEYAKAVERHFLELKQVVGTPMTLITYRVDGPRIYVFSLIDNLCKGAATQAIENFNLCHGWPAELGLIPQSTGAL